MSADALFEQLAAWAGCDLSPPLCALLQRIHGAAVGPMQFYAPVDLQERNQTYDTRGSCPGWLSIGDDGGGVAIVVWAADWPTPVCLVGHGSMSPADFVRVAPDLQAWLTAGCPRQQL